MDCCDENTTYNFDQYVIWPKGVRIDRKLIGHSVIYSFEIKEEATTATDTATDIATHVMFLTSCFSHQKLPDPFLIFYLSLFLLLLRYCCLAMSFSSIGHDFKLF